MTLRRIDLLLSLGMVALATGCSIDDRKLKVSGACVTPPAGGLISDFSAARPQPCPAGICSPDLVGNPSVYLDAADTQGLIFPYRSPGLAVIALTLTSTGSPPYSGQALRAVMDSGSPQLDASNAYDGLALQFVDCVDTATYSGVSFTIGGNLGSCPLRFAVQFKAVDAGIFSTPCAIDECFATRSVLVAAGKTTFTFSGNGGVGGPGALAGMQWEFGIPSAPPGGCTGDFTIDDIRLISGL